MEEARKQQLIRRAEETVNSASDAAAAMLSQCGYSKEVFARAALTADHVESEDPGVRNLFAAEGAAWVRPARVTARWAVRRHHPREERQGASPDRVHGRHGPGIRRAIKDIVIRGNIVTQDDDEAGGWQYEEGLKPILRHVPNLDGNMPTASNIIVSYALAFMPGNPQPEFVVLSRKRLDHIRTTYGKSPAGTPSSRRCASRRRSRPFVISSRSDRGSCSTASLSTTTRCTRMWEPPTKTQDP